MGQIGKRHAQRDAPFEKGSILARARRGQFFGVGICSERMREAGGKEHDFRRFIARIVRAVAEMHTRRLELSRHAIDGRADGFARGGRARCAATSAPAAGSPAAGFSGCVG